MTTDLRVDWQHGSPYVGLIQRLTTAAARGWKDRDPLEALPAVWWGLRTHYPKGSLVDPTDRLLRTIVHRRVSNDLSRSRGRATIGGRLVSSDPGIFEVPDPSSLSPDRELEDQELIDRFWAELAGLSSRRREAVLCKLGLARVGSAVELARSWGTSPQNVHRLAKKGLEQLRAALAEFE